MKSPSIVSSLTFTYQHSALCLPPPDKVQLLHGGTGSPVLYLHGVAADIHSLPADGGFTTFHDTLAESFSLYAAALPGYADTEGYDDLENIEDMVFFCLDVLDALNLEKVHLIGTAFGGWVATAFATRYAHRLDKLVLINLCGISTREAHIGNFFYTVTPKAEGGNDEVRELLFFDPNSELAIGAIPDEMSPEAQFLCYKAQMVSARVGWTLPTLYNPRLKDRLFRATIPTHIVAATGDKLVPSALAEIYAGGIPNAEVSQISDSAHAVWLEQPQKAAEAVASFRTVNMQQT